MTLLEYNIENAEHLDVLEDGTEVEVRCTEAEVRTSDNSGNQYIFMVLEPQGYDDVADIRHIQMLPNDGMRSKDVQETLARIRDMYDAFGAPYGAEGFRVEDLEGQHAQATLGVEDDSQYGKRNRVRTFVKAR